MRALPFAIVGLLPTFAHATNTRHERTPTLFPDAPCMTLVDRSDGVLHLDYGIPFEDVIRQLAKTPPDAQKSRRLKKGPQFREKRG